MSSTDLDDGLVTRGPSPGGSLSEGRPESAVGAAVHGDAGERWRASVSAGWREAEASVARCGLPEAAAREALERGGLRELDRVTVAHWPIVEAELDRVADARRAKREAEAFVAQLDTLGQQGWAPQPPPEPWRVQPAGPPTQEDLDRAWWAGALAGLRVGADLAAGASQPAGNREPATPAPARPQVAGRRSR